MTRLVRAIRRPHCYGFGSLRNRIARTGRPPQNPPANVNRDCRRTVLTVEQSLRLETIEFRYRNRLGSHDVRQVMAIIIFETPSRSQRTRRNRPPKKSMVAAERHARFVGCTATVSVLLSIVSRTGRPPASFGRGNVRRIRYEFQRETSTKYRIVF